MGSSNISLTDLTTSSRYVVLDNVDISTDSHSSILSSSTEVSSSDNQLTRIYSPNSLIYTSDTTSEISRIVTSGQAEQTQIAAPNLATLPIEEAFRELRLKDFTKVVEKDIVPIQPKMETAKHARLRGGKEADVKIIIGEQQIRCQHIILVAYSKYFAKRPFSAKYTLPVEEVPPKAFEQIYDWMLQDKAQTVRENIVDVLQAATYLDVVNLTKQMWYCVDLDNYFTELNAFLLFLEARGKPLGSMLEELMLRRITKSFLTLLTTKEFVELSLKHVKLLFKSDTIAVNTEKEVFYAAVLWLNYDWAERQKYMIEVLECTRMQLLPMPFLNELKSPSKIHELDCLIKTKEFQTHLMDAIFAQSINHFGCTNKNIGDICKGFDIVKSVPRLFIYDSNSSYHKMNPNARQANVSYNDFMKYLKVLQSAGQKYYKSLKVEHIQDYKPC